MSVRVGGASIGLAQKPGSFLNSFGVGGLGAAFTKDTPTEVFSRIGENFIRWLRGEIVWDASTSPVVLAAA